MYPAPNWLSTKTGFTFGAIYPKNFGALAGQRHLGLDKLYPRRSHLIAPFSGRAEKQYSATIGNAVFFYPDGKPVVMRFMHNDQYVKLGRVNKGDLLAYTGDTGATSPQGGYKTPHIHADIWDLKFGPLNIYNFNGFIDPAKFDWFYDERTHMAQIKSQAKGPSRRIVLEAADQTEWLSLCNVFGKDPNAPEETVNNA